MRKKPKLKPSSNVAKVLDLMKADDKTSVKEIVAKTGLKTENVYAIRNYIKKRGLMGGKAVAETKPKRAYTKPSDKIKDLNKGVVEMEQTILKLHSQVSGLSSELNRVRHMYMDQLAVVRYLENKLMQFVEAQNTGRNQ